MERNKCWLVPMRPVTPFMMMPILCCIIWICLCVEVFRKFYILSPHTSEAENGDYLLIIYLVNMSSKETK